MNMAIMDVATIEPLAQALVRLLVKGGMWVLYTLSKTGALEPRWMQWLTHSPTSFVATLLHPVFFTSGASRNIDVRYRPETGEMETDRTMVVRNYLSVPPAKGIAVPGQPQKQVGLTIPTLTPSYLSPVKARRGLEVSTRPSLLSTR